MSRGRIYPLLFAFRSLLFTVTAFVSFVVVNCNTKFLISFCFANQCMEVNPLSLSYSHSHSHSLGLITYILSLPLCSTHEAAIPASSSNSRLIAPATRNDNKPQAAMLLHGSRKMWTCGKCSYAYNRLWSESCEMCETQAKQQQQQQQQPEPGKPANTLTITTDTRTVQ